MKDKCPVNLEVCVFRSVITGLRAGLLPFELDTDSCHSGRSVIVETLIEFAGHNKDGLTSVYN